MKKQLVTRPRPPHWHAVATMPDRLAAGIRWPYRLPKPYRSQREAAKASEEGQQPHHQQALYCLTCYLSGQP